MKKKINKQLIKDTLPSMTSKTNFFKEKFGIQMVLWKINWYFFMVKILYFTKYFNLTQREEIFIGLIKLIHLISVTYLIIYLMFYYWHTLTIITIILAV